MAQTLQLQSIAMEASALLSKDLLETKDKMLRTRQAASIASLVKAFDTLEDRKRILRGKPMPGSLRPDGPKTKKKAKRSVLSIAHEPTDPLPEPAKESLSPPPSPDPTTGGEGFGGGVAI